MREYAFHEETPRAGEQRLAIPTCIVVLFTMSGTHESKSREENSIDALNSLERRYEVDTSKSVGCERSKSLALSSYKIDRIPRSL